jgi:acetylornithine deacetylase/succinyl-diaminopimelate desuccinylase-like protein
MREFRSHHRSACLTAMLALAILMLFSPPQRALGQTMTPELKHFGEIYKELVEINTTDSVGDTTQAAHAMAARFSAAGFDNSDIHVIVPPGAPKKGNLVVRYRGTGSKKPILLLAHLDVVEAKRDDWERDPFKLVEEGGYFYARGSIDDKAQASSFVSSLIRFKQEGYRPDRDLILALTADEELASVSKWNGIRWLVDHNRNLIDAEFTLNEGGLGYLKNGKPLLNNVQAAEKVLVNFRLEVKNQGGHSALPRKDNAIYELADGLTRLAKFDFPVKLNEITKGYFSRNALVESGQLAEDMRAVVRDVPDPQAAARLAASPHFNALMRTTCVATRLEGGHANNALPQTARALVNCRILPGEPVDEVQRMLAQAVGDKVTVTRASEPQPSPPSPLRQDVMQTIEKLTAEFWPGIPVVPVMGTGATDARTLRAIGIPVYGVSGLFIDVNDNRTHGLNERVLVKSLYDMDHFLYRLVKSLTGGQ